MLPVGDNALHEARWVEGEFDCSDRIRITKVDIAER